METSMKKLTIPHIRQCDETSCASASYAMVANALGFDVSLADILKITGGQLGQAQFWNWCLDNGVKIRCASKNDDQALADSGALEWSKKTPAWVFRFFADRTSNGFHDSTAKFKKILKDPNFQFSHGAPNFDLVKELFDAGHVVEIMGDGWLMYGEKPDAQLLHRVVVTGIDGEALYFHDPAFDGEENHRASALDINLALSVDGAEVIGYARS
jgi:hypothetical protein